MPRRPVITEESKQASSAKQCAVRHPELLRAIDKQLRTDDYFWKEEELACNEAYKENLRDKQEDYYND